MLSTSRFRGPEPRRFVIFPTLRLKVEKSGTGLVALRQLQDAGNHPASPGFLEPLAERGAIRRRGRPNSTFTMRQNCTAASLNTGGRPGRPTLGEAKPCPCPVSPEADHAASAPRYMISNSSCGSRLVPASSCRHVNIQVSLDDESRRAANSATRPPKSGNKYQYIIIRSASVKAYQLHRGCAQELPFRAYIYIINNS